MRVKDCLDCTKTAKQRRLALDKMIVLAHIQAKKDNEEKVIYKKSATGDFAITTPALARIGKYTVIEIIPVVQ